MKLQSLALLGKFTPVSYDLKPGLSYEEWSLCGLQLVQRHEAVKWELGDWLCYGEDHFDKWTQAADATGYTPEYLQVVMAVARRYPVDTRVNGLHWSHHRVVMKLEPKERQELLEHARDKYLSVRDLEQIVRDKAPATPEARTEIVPAIGYCMHCHAKETTVQPITINACNDCVELMREEKDDESRF